MMTNEEILKKAIEKAIKNGWEYEHKGFNYMYEYMSTIPYVINGFLFSPSFAKAFWGDKRTTEMTNNCHRCGEFYEPIAWQ